MADEIDSSDGSRNSGGITRAAMWLGGSALLGSLALVLWNRRALRSMREAPAIEEKPVSPLDDNIY